jgi:hypothetical protein
MTACPLYLIRSAGRDFTQVGTRIVLHARVGNGRQWISCLYVNNGETITSIRGRHCTLSGAKKWAAKQLAS